ncbi:uncharacterized protein BDZ99DRAFT_457375 [Mytilinidion resinicola]|uniref:Conidiation-specific expression protein n=1 Tax=Mytilinidion resinicola TaxID=574789 RepID=A0A6A6Z954_9PEZI|nr:uncharacterized protein BDZ99DRAFT_457375 [Mytilinidion resinicola]KAF2817651.1 hypothetical protein BDZ99DRAFT_457375 [Mytilinidion resinicola]
MPNNPFQQKYSTQSHKIFAEIPATPDTPAAPAEARRSMEATSSPPGRRRSSVTTRFANLEALKHPNTEEAAARRASMADHKIGSPGVIGNLWNSWTRGSTAMVKETPGSNAKNASTSSK